MKKFILFSLACLSFQMLSAQLPLQSFHVKNKVEVTNVDKQLTRMAVILPLAKTNPYQTVSNLDVRGGEWLNFPDSDDSYIRWTLTDNLPAANQSQEIYYEFDITLHSVDFDFSRIKKIYPYDTASDNYRWYTGSNGEYVDPGNASICKIGNALWAHSSNTVDYARRCYEYVAATYKYINPYTGLHTLQEILNAGGGDCGNLSSIFISLLRYKSIPARHIITVKPDGEYHVWADFYLERYGWIPVDVTFKNSDPGGNYFGKYDGNGIVMSKQVWLPIDPGNGNPYYDQILQGYRLWFWGSHGSKMYSTHILSSTQLKEDQPQVTENSEDQNASIIN